MGREMRLFGIGYLVRVYLVQSPKSGGREGAGHDDRNRSGHKNQCQQPVVNLVLFLKLQFQFEQYQRDQIQLPEMLLATHGCPHKPLLIDRQSAQLANTISSV